MDNKIEFTPNTISYKDKYEKLKQTLEGLYRFLEGSEVLVVNPKSSDLGIKEGGSYKEAYFNLLASFHERSKENPTCIRSELNHQKPAELSQASPDNEVTKRPLATLSFKKDIYETLDSRDRFLTELLHSIYFLRNKISEYKVELGKEDTGLEDGVKNLIRRIAIDLYSYHPKSEDEKKTRDKLLGECLHFNEQTSDYENNKALKELSVTKEQYIACTMERWIEDKKKGIETPCFYQLIESILTPKNYYLSFLDANKADWTLCYYSQEDEKTAAFNTLLEKQNPVIIKALLEKYQDPSATPETKILIYQFAANLNKFQQNALGLQTKAALFQNDKRMHKAAKANYYNKVKKNIETKRKKAFSEQYNTLMMQAEKLFDQKSASQKKILGIVLMVLGAAMTAIAIALAVVLAPPIAVAVIPSVACFAMGLRFFQLASKETAAKELISRTNERGEQAIDTIIAETKTIPGGG